MGVKKKVLKYLTFNYLNVLLLDVHVCLCLVSLTEVNYKLLGLVFVE